MRKNWLELDEKIYIVTGASNGVGKSIALSLTENNAKVVVCDIETPTYDCDFIKCDVTKKDEIEKLISYTTNKYGKIDGVINNAGINRPRLLVDAKCENSEYELSEEDFDSMININLKGVFFLSQAVAKEFIKQNDGGIILNVSSEAGQEGSAGQSVYSATKGAINAFTRSWAKELGKYNIRVMGVAPGILEKTNLRTFEYDKALAYTRGVKRCDLGSDYSKVIPLKRDGKLTEVADLVTYLMSNRASYLTGTTFNISGGKSRG